MPHEGDNGVAGAARRREADTLRHLASIKSTTKDAGLVLSRLVSANDVAARLLSLRTLLQACVNADPSMSSIGFLAPLSDAQADEYWTAIGSLLDRPQPSVFLFVVTSPSPSSALSIDDNDNDNDNTAPATAAVAGETAVLGTIQVLTIPKANHSHRAEVAKLLVRPSARRMGLASMLMAHAEAFAKHTLDKKLLTLDTMSTTPARDFYLRTGWTEWGQCPSYAAMADGSLGMTSFFHKFLE